MLKPRKLAMYILNEIEEMLGANGIKVPVTSRSDEACKCNCLYYELEDKLTELISFASRGEICVKQN